MVFDSPTVENVADRLAAMAADLPDAIAVASPGRYDSRGHRRYECITFGQLDADANRVARGLVRLGVRPAMRLVLLVPPGIDFVVLVFALMRAAAVAVLIDPGMGRGSLIRSLSDVTPDGFVTMPRVHLMRRLFAHRFPQSRFHVTVGRYRLGAGTTIGRLRSLGDRDGVDLPRTTADDPAAIIFTSGGTGPPKGVLYRHRNFDAQIVQIRDRYGIEPGAIDLPGFPLFGLFNAAMGVTTVIPDMDASRPAKVDPRKIIEAIDDWNVTQAFGSPAIWNRVGRYCQERHVRLPSLRRVLSAGAPVPADVLERMRACIDPAGEVHTPYGATEALPVASISAREVLGHTARQTDAGAGVCVGQKFAGIDWKVIRIVPGPIASIGQVEEMPVGQTGELIVRGPQVTSRYVTRPEWNARSKIVDGDSFWHRMGDVGYHDQQGRFWFCGRVSHRVITAAGPLDSVRCEAIFNVHTDVRRTALVGIGDAPAQQPVLVVQPRRGRLIIPGAGRRRLLADLRRLADSHSMTASIDRFLFRRSLPVDVRHNAKIAREKLARWAARRCGSAPNEPRP